MMTEDVYDSTVRYIPKHFTTENLTKAAQLLQIKSSLILQPPKNAGRDDGVFGAIPVGFAFDFVGFRCMLRQGRGRRKNADQAFLHFLFAVLSVFSTLTVTV